MEKEKPKGRKPKTTLDDVKVLVSLYQSVSGMNPGSLPPGKEGVIKDIKSKILDRINASLG